MKVRLFLFVFAACSGETTAPRVSQQVGTQPASQATLEQPVEVPAQAQAQAPGSPAGDERNDDNFIPGTEPASQATLAPPVEAPAEVSAFPVGDEQNNDNLIAFNAERATAAGLAEQLMDAAGEMGDSPNEVSDFVDTITNSAPTATDDDRRARPRSARRGRPDVASSCNTIAFVSECMETARTATGQGYRSTERMCVNGIWSTTDPCPEAARTGTCRITDDQQVVHYYFSPSEHAPDPIARARGVCERYNGEFFTERTHPLNGG